MVVVNENTRKTEARKARRGAHAAKPKPRVVPALFLLVGFVLVLLPSVGMIWAPTDSTTENRELAAAPALFSEDGSFNVDVLADAGTFFGDHFAYRNQLVSTNARLRGLLGTSATDQVVIGQDGWLYYGGTLPDYLGQSALTDRALRNVAHNLALAQEYAQAHGAVFAFTVAPNKNTLYDQHMPYYYLPSPQPSNAERLEPILQEYRVNYVNLFDVFQDMQGEWYLKGDSHWDNRGALIATNELMGAVGNPTLEVQVEDGVERVDFTGDLASMLYPYDAKTESNWYFEGFNDEVSATESGQGSPGSAGSRWRYEEGSDVTDSWVATSSNASKGSLLMFRDSFGNALLPFWAASYKQAAFSKLVPYNLPKMLETGADTVVVERAERHISYLAENPPIMPSPTANVKASEVGGESAAAAYDVRLNAVTNGPYVEVTGAVLSDALAADDELYIAVGSDLESARLYDAFWTTVAAEDAAEESAAGAAEANDYGFKAYLDVKGYSESGETIRVIVRSQGECFVAHTFESVPPNQQ